MKEDDLFTITLPKSIERWLDSKAIRMGLPSRDNLVLLFVRQAWQKEHLEQLGLSATCIDEGTKSDS